MLFCFAFICIFTFSCMTKLFPLWELSWAKPYLMCRFNNHCLDWVNCELAILSGGSWLKIYSSIISPNPDIKLGPCTLLIEKTATENGECLFAQARHISTHCTLGYQCRKDMNIQMNISASYKGLHIILSQVSAK